MRPSLLEDTLTTRVAAHLSGALIRPALVEGSPGVGKTQMIRAIAERLGIGYIGLHAPLMLHEDFGMPRFTSEGEIDFATPGHKFPFVDAPGWPETGIIAVEEVAQSENSQQKIWANLFQERELHGRKLKPGWYFIATGNRISDRAGANRILSHFNDRFTTYTFDPNLDDWCTWALAHGVRPEVVAYCRWKPGNLSNFNPALDKCPTPRAWTEGVSPVLDTVPAAALFDTVKGDVGEGCAAEFTGFLQTYRELPNPDLILSDPHRHPVPTEVHILYALSGALAHRASPENFGAIIDFACRMPPEFMVLVVRDASRVCPAVEDTAAYTKWAVGPGKDALLGRG
jgi:hypothetical protein